jgi:hypothetical protein
VDLGVFNILDDGLDPDMNTQLLRIKDPIRRFRGYDRLSQNLPSPSLLFFWAKKIADASSDLIEKYNPSLIFASSPPAATFYAGYLIHKKSGLPLVLDYRDQWTFNPYQSRSGILHRWDHFLETKILKNSTLVIVTNQGRQVEHKTFWPSLSQETVVIPNGFDLKDFDDLPQGEIEEKSTNVLTIRHMGALYGSRAESLHLFLEELCSYLFSHHIEKKLRIELFGSSFPNDIENFQSSTNQLSVCVKGAVKYKQSLSFELTSDALLLIIGKHQQSNSETTSKIFEYIASGRPIVVIGESQSVREMVSHNPKFFFVDDYPPEEVYDDLLGWLFEYKASTSINKNEFDEYFNRRTIARSLSLLFDKIQVSDERADFNIA